MKKLYSVICIPRRDPQMGFEHSVWENEDLARDVADAYYDIFFDVDRYVVSQRLDGPTIVCGSVDFMKLMDAAQEMKTDSREDREIDKAVYG